MYYVIDSQDIWKFVSSNQYLSLILAIVNSRLHNYTKIGRRIWRSIKDKSPIVWTDLVAICLIELAIAWKGLKYRADFKSFGREWEMISINQYQFFCIYQLLQIDQFFDNSTPVEFLK